MSFINNVLSRINMAEFLAMISKWWTCIIDSACALYILKKSRINIVRLFWIRAQSYVGILKMYCTFVFGLCIINPVTSMDHSTFEKCTCIINPACPFCHLHHFWRNLVPPVWVAATVYEGDPKIISPYKRRIFLANPQKSHICTKNPKNPYYPMDQIALTPCCLLPAATLNPKRTKPRPPAQALPSVPRG